MAVNDDHPVKGVDSQPRLGCGRLMDDVWATADEPPNAHEASCPFCQRTRASMHDLAEAADALSAHEDESPEYTPGRHVKDLVMQLVHVEVRRGQPIPLLNTDPPGGPPDLTLSEQAVLDVIWRAADALPGIRARHCAVHLEPTHQQPGQPAAVEVDVDIAVAAGLSIPQMGARLRVQLADQIAAETGLSVQRIGITVEDLYDA
jgi:hypothetical protein